MANHPSALLGNDHLTNLEKCLVSAYRAMREIHGAEACDRASDEFFYASLEKPASPRPPKYYPLTVLNDPSLTHDEKGLVFAYWSIRDNLGDGVAARHVGEFIQRALTPLPVRLVSATSRPPARRRPTNRGQVSVRLVKGGAR